MATGSVAETTARLASWCERVPRGLAMVEFDSELAGGRVVENLRARLTAIDVPFREFALPAAGGPRPVVRELLCELGSLRDGVVSISGFENAFPLSGSHQEELGAFNFQRERLAEPPLRQIWWLPVRVADAFRRGAYDLYSWFIVRLYLTEMIAPLPRGPQLESWIAETSGALPTSLDDARQRATELAGRFVRALDDHGKPVEELARELMAPALRALEEAGAEREARELERDLRRRAREKQRPFPPRVFIGYSHDPPEHVDRVLDLADRLRAEGVDARLDTLQRAEAVEFLLKRTNREDAGEAQRLAAGELATELGGLKLEPAAYLFSRAGIYSFEQGRYQQAVTLFEQSLAICEKVLGTEHPHVATALNNLANSYAAQGNYASATPLHERSLAIREKVLGSENLDVAQSLNNLANLYSAQGDNASAALLYGRSLAICEKRLGPEHPHVAMSLNNLANLHSTQGDTELAAELYERSLVIREKALGPDHPHVATVLESYALLLAKTDRAEEAAKLEARAKAIRANCSAHGPSEVRE